MTQVKFLAEAHFPAWDRLQRVTQAKSPLKAQLLFFAPMALGTFILVLWMHTRGINSLGRFRHVQKSTEEAFPNYWDMESNNVIMLMLQYGAALNNRKQCEAQ